MSSNKQIVENLEARPYKCYHCSYILGITTDHHLVIGAVQFSRHITFECGVCKRVTFWKPRDEKFKDAK